MGVSKRASKYATVPPGRWHCEQFASRYDRARSCRLRVVSSAAARVGSDARSASFTSGVNIFKWFHARIPLSVTPEGKLNERFICRALTPSTPEVFLL